MKSIQTSGKQPLAKTTQAQIQVMYINTGCMTYQKNGVLLCWTTVFLTVSVYRTVTLQTHQYCYALWTVCNLLHIIFSHLSPIMSVWFVHLLPTLSYCCMPVFFVLCNLVYSVNRYKSSPCWCVCSLCIGPYLIPHYHSLNRYFV